MLTPVLVLLVFHGILGGADVLINHELRERLPSSVSARSEQALHSARELVFAAIFGVLAWLQWRRLPTGFAVAHYGVSSWLLTALSLAALAWCIRNGLSYAALGKCAAKAGLAAPAG